MTREQALQKAQMKLQNATVETIKDAVRQMNDNLEISQDAFDLALSVLESRMNEPEFVAFCETL